MDAASLVERRVRDAVRELRIDPLLESDRVRALVDTAVAEVAGEGLVSDPIHAAQCAFDAIAGFGPLQPLLDDESVEEVWINAPGRVFVARVGRSELTTVVLSDADVRVLVERMLRASGRRVDISSPFVDAMLPDGSRLHVVIPDITHRHWAVNIRRFVVRPHSVTDLVARGMLTVDCAEFLEASVRAGLSIVVSGATQAGKTTMLNALLAAIPSTERVVTCEEVFEVRLDRHPDWVALQTRDAGIEGVGEISLRRLIREALRMRPTRLVVGEVRQEEALDLLVAMNSGLPAMSTLHANGAREAITKLCTLPLLAGQNISSAFVIPTVASCVDLVVHLSTTPSGHRRVTEVLAVPGRVEDGAIETATIFADRGQGLVAAGGFPPHEERFRRHGIDLASLLSGQR